MGSEMCIRDRSATDVRIATWPDGTSVWPEVYYFLVTLQDITNPNVRAFEINDGEISEVDIIKK